MGQTTLRRPDPIRAVIYARFSSDLQRDASIDDQIRSCRDYAVRQGLKVIQVFSDRAVSGASLMRSGLQHLLSKAATGAIDVVISEALDRLSRNQADIATIHQRLEFNNVRIETLSEGQISEMHIGLKGTMNALYLKDLAQKTHRGLKGRVLDGKSAGGASYGYRTVQKFDKSGTPIRGDREILPEEADVIRRIYQDYASGLSPKKIAETLNIEGIPGPQGGVWGASTIHGNPERGSGILNNELYIGRQVWNRLRYVKDPQTGKRVSRANPEEDWVITEVPDLRIVPDALWHQVRARQKATKSKGTSIPVWDRRRPKTLFSGLMACGCCGGGFAKVSKDSFGCSTARNKGKALCTNMRLIKQKDLEGRVLSALSEHLMDPEAVAIFCEEYTAERNRLAASAHQTRGKMEKELAQARRDHARLVDAILAGIPADQVKERMTALDARAKEIERALSSLQAPDPVRLHPGLAGSYQKRLRSLILGLGDANGMQEAKEALRALVEKIVLSPAESQPAEGQPAGLTIDLFGSLAGLLRLAMGLPLGAGAVSRSERAKCKEPAVAGLEVFEDIEEFVLVAGAGFEPAAFRL